MSSAVSRPPAATSERAASHFAALLEFETDCWDTHHAINNGRQDFVLMDDSGEDAYNKGHLPEALHLPHQQIREARMAEYAGDTLFVVYCAGPHCNGADKAALNLANLGRPVKKMIGGITGWLDEGFKLI